MSNQTYKYSAMCPDCLEIFTRPIRLQNHLKNKKDECGMKKSIRRNLINQEIQLVKNAYEKELSDKRKKSKKKDLIYKKKIAKLQKQNTVNLKYISELEKKNNPMPEIKIIPFPEYTPEKLAFKVFKENLGMMDRGDVRIFKKIFIDSIPPKQQCIRLKDYSRKKVIVYCRDKIWRKRDLSLIVQQFLNQLTRHGYNKVIREKSLEKDRIFEEFADPAEANFQITLIDQRYKEKSAHWAKLIQNNSRHLNKVVRGVLDLYQQYRESDYN
jgi:hypothetical protein